MTNAEKVGDIFGGLTLKTYIDYPCIPLDCSNVSCSKCPLGGDCTIQGFQNWLEQEYQGDETVGYQLGYDKGYEKGLEEGKEAGKAEVYNMLSKIFLRKEEE